MNDRATVSEHWFAKGRTVGLAVLTLVTAVVLFSTAVPLGVPGEWAWKRQSMPGSVFEAADRLLEPMVCGSLILVLAVFGIRRNDQARGIRGILWLAVLWAASSWWLHSVRQAAESPHRELRPLWILYDKYATGYFQKAAFEVTSVPTFLRDYYAEMKKGDVLHEGTHPPGLVLLNAGALEACQASSILTSLMEFTLNAEAVSMFRSVEREAAFGRPLDATQLAALQLTALVSHWVIAALPVVLYFLVETLADRRTAWQAALLSICLPSIGMFCPRSDAVYAVSGLLMLLLLVRGVRASSITGTVWWGGLLGGWTFCCLLVSLAHLPVIVAGGIFCGLWTMSAGHSDGARVSVLDRGRVLSCLKLLATAGIAFAVGLLIWQVSTHCDITSVWIQNLKNHQAFYSQSPRTWWIWTIVNPIELAFAAGLPAFAFSIAGVLSATRAWRIRRDSTADSSTICLSLALAATWSILWLSGKNMGEAARLWCFVTPWCVLIALKNDVAKSPQSARMAVPVDLLVCQMAVCIMTTGRVSGFLEL